MIPQSLKPFFAFFCLFCGNCASILPFPHFSKRPFFDLVALSKIVDYFFVMGYGTDALNANEVARSNSAILSLSSGIQGYKAIGVDIENKIVLGLPW